jgi:hypothetical protein
MSIKDQLLEIGFLTGSRAYGTEKKDSDFDIVINIKDLQMAYHRIGDKEVKESEYFGGFYFSEGDDKINVIPVHPNEYEPWYFTTKAMTAILEHAVCSQEEKYAMFSGIKALFCMGNFNRKEEPVVMDPSLDF